MMQAIVMTAAGGPEVLQVVDVPVPELSGDHDVRVRLLAAGVNPIDTKVRQTALYHPDRLPAVLGCDGAGVVDAVGPAVTRFKPGDEVYFFNNGIGGAPGNYAELTLVHEDYLAAKPKRLSMVEAAALPLVLITAWEGLFDRGRLHPEEAVLVHAGAGGVGHIAVQLASNIGARVAATASSAKADFVRGLGAEAVIDYRQENFAEAAKRWSGGRGVDLVLDTVGGETFNQSFTALALYGRISTLVQSPFDANLLKYGRARCASIHYILMLAPLIWGDPAARVRQRQILEAGARLADAGRLQVHVAETLPLAQARRAHELVETGHTTGKVVLTM
jgi:NADPH:quinone reductase